MTKLEFIQKAREVHNGKYLYFDGEYVDRHTKMKMVCYDHGSFWQTPHNHLSGRGCPKCGHEKIGIGVWLSKLGCWGDK